VEFALVAPLFLLLLFGIVEASLMMNAQASLDNATREGVRAAAVCGSRLNTWTFQGNQYAASGTAQSPCQSAAADIVTQNLGILPSDAGVGYNVAVKAPASNTPGSCTSPYCAPPGTVIEVTVNYPYNFYFGNLFGQSSPVIFMSSTARAVSQQ
jgi:Flp pilus assembly protein TadG